MEYLKYSTFHYLKRGWTASEEAKQLKKRKAAEQKLDENEKLEIARFLPWSVSSLSLSKHDLTDDMRGSIDEITKGSAITAALSSAD